MHVIFISDHEPGSARVMPMTQAIKEVTAVDQGKKYQRDFNLFDLRDALNHGCGWYEGGHALGRFVMIRADLAAKAGLALNRDATLDQREKLIRIDERRNCSDAVARMNKEKLGYEWLAGTVWDNILQRACTAINGMELPK